MDKHTTNDELRQQLAAIEHERWADWQRWIHQVGTRQEDGSIKIPPHLVERWERQIKTPYNELDDREKASDMEQVDRYWPLIKKHELDAKQQGALNVMTQFKADRIKHTLGTPVNEWERELETADKTLLRYVNALKAEREAL